MLWAGALWQGQPPAAKLSVAQATLHERKEDGPAITPNYEYYSGELMYLSFRVSGFKAIKDKVDVRWQVVAVDPEGRLLAPPANGSVQEELSSNDKNWMPKVAHTLALPSQLPPGAYKLKVHVADELANDSVEKEIEFKVGGKPFPQVKELSILELKFYRSETDRTPLDPAMYHTGETLLARFQLAGFELGEKNKFDVDYGLSILSASGKVLYTQEQAAADSGSPFYPQRLLNGILTLNLTAGVQAAQYTLVVKARDHVGNKEAESRAQFTVEK